ncbi:hypothetical protein ASPZODRAFT_1980810 [Penicilliopsis zonata CBS 506.65]|uniref:Uncharacterized protein n=1 Tax=Penicilliopsis zonata CBS 506.65 TaxID=1073090 RepID=A0A1L9SHT3_9EURO|nr:hypothetical protein ASPZODRAFT_1980810 [Penicilliopsis zonata CBS 506.65]OJJ46604.1 hypothetical protein ASPZODRAFT_1980810 [Penicilliopsis zonata CBS 506.65]
MLLGRQTAPLDGARGRHHALSKTLAGWRQRESKNRSPVPSPLPSPTCEESIHYPVFNPHDPRHNPSATSTWVQTGYWSHMSSSQRSIRWVQSLPGRSIRKARSGLSNLRTGIYRRSIPSDSASRGDLDDVCSLPESVEACFDNPERHFPDTISEASTEHDSEFGAELHRACPSLIWEAAEDACEGSSTPLSDIVGHRRLDGTPGTSSILLSDTIPCKLSNETFLFGSLLPETASQRPRQADYSGFGRLGYALGAASSNQSLGSRAPQIGEIRLNLKPLRLFDHSAAESSSYSCLDESENKPPDEQHPSSFYNGDIPMSTQIFHSQPLSSNDHQRRDNDMVNTPEQPDDAEKESLLSDMQPISNLAGLPPVQSTKQHGLNPNVHKPPPLSLCLDEDSNHSPWSERCSPTEDGDYLSAKSTQDGYCIVHSPAEGDRSKGFHGSFQTRRNFSIHGNPGFGCELTQKNQAVPEIVGPGWHLRARAVRLKNRMKRESKGSLSSHERLHSYSRLSQHFHS